MLLLSLFGLADFRLDRNQDRLKLSNFPSAFLRWLHLRQREENKKTLFQNAGRKKGLKRF